MNIELLAPAGDFERLRIALLYGADAVYFGGQDFSLRANAQNFSIDDIKRATEYAHSLGKKVYVTVNIVFHDKDLQGLDEYLLKLDEIGIDAIILSDLVVLDTAKKLGCKFELHISTQASTLNYEAARFYKSEGVSRVVLAREASKRDIKRIKDETGLELECFIHGAMCTAFSGRCVLSNYVTNRDSNRGGCAQVCRFMFKIDDNEQEFTMMPKDLNMISYIEEMIEIGVNSFKVEGRMRSIYYIATVIDAYKRIIDLVVNKKLNSAYTRYYLDILNRCANRDSTPQFFNELASLDEQYFSGRNEGSNQDFLGLVLDYQDGVATVLQRNYFKRGDVVEFIGPGKDVQELEIGEMYDEKGLELDVARHPMTVVKIPCNLELEKDDMMRIKVFDIKDYL